MLDRDSISWSHVFCPKCNEVTKLRTHIENVEDVDNTYDLVTTFFCRRCFNTICKLYSVTARIPTIDEAVV